MPVDIRSRGDLSSHVEHNSSRVTTRSPGYSTGLSATAASVAFALDTVFEAVQADSPVHRFDMAALLPLALEAGSMAVVAGSKVAAVAAEIES